MSADRGFVDAMDTCLKRLEGRWTCQILYLLDRQHHAVEQLLRALPNAHPDDIESDLAALESNKLTETIDGNIYLTARGRSLVPVVVQMALWGDIFKKRHVDPYSD